MNGISSEHRICVSRDIISREQATNYRAPAKSIISINTNNIGNGIRHLAVFCVCSQLKRNDMIWACWNIQIFRQLWLNRFHQAIFPYNAQYGKLYWNYLEYLQLKR